MRSRKPIIIAACLLLSSLLFTGCSISELLGLRTLGELEGVVYDGATGGTRRLSGVRVVVGGKSTDTNTNGEYKLDGIPTGQHQLTASKAGYLTYSAKVEIQKPGVSDPTANKHSFTLRYDE